MSLTGVAQLFGAIRIVPDVDSIGIAVFGVPGGNTMYIAETDASFRISEFMDFVNTEGYELEFNLPKDQHLVPYSLHEPTPIPFWVDGNCHIIAGDAESDDLFRKFGDAASEHSVLRDLRRLLSDARNGVYQEQQDQWLVEEIASSFDDIFHKTPVHSRYWITRLGEAVRYARSLTRPPHPVDDELRRISLDWIERFATKTDYIRLTTVMQNLLTGAISMERARAMVFAFLVNKLGTGKFAEFENQIKKDAWFRELFPEGIYHYWWRYNWPLLPFKYKRQHDILDPLLAEIRNGRAKKDFHRAERMSYLYFRREKAPSEVSDAVIPLINRYNERMHVAFRDAEELFDNPIKSYAWEGAARKVLYYYYMLMSLDGIIDGTHRLSRTIIEGRFGYSTSYIKELGEIANVHLR